MNAGSAVAIAAKTACAECGRSTPSMALPSRAIASTPGDCVSRRWKRRVDSLHAAFEVGEAAVDFRIGRDRPDLVGHLAGLVGVGRQHQHVVERAEATERIPLRRAPEPYRRETLSASSARPTAPPPQVRRARRPKSRAPRGRACWDSCWRGAAIHRRRCRPAATKLSVAIRSDPIAVFISCFSANASSLVDVRVDDRADRIRPVRALVVRDRSTRRA